MRERASLSRRAALVRDIIADGNGRRAAWPARPCATCVRQWAWITMTDRSQRKRAARRAGRDRPRRAASPNPVARAGEPLAQMPLDLYIPPDALAVMLDAFEGPLDLLLYLIRKANVNILDIPMAPLTRQYLDYVEGDAFANLELAADYLVMAAMLIEIKSRMLLPRRKRRRGRRGRGSARRTGAAA